MKFKIGDFVEVLNTQDMGNDLGGIGDPMERAWGERGTVIDTNKGLNAINIEWEKKIRGKVNKSWYYAYRFDLVNAIDALGEIIDMGDPKTNAGRKICFWCGKKTKKIALFRGYTDYCKNCDK